MLGLKLHPSLGLLFVVVASAAGGAWLYHRYRDSDWERREAEYQRQLSGHLTAREKEIEALNTRLGTAHSQLVTQSDLDKKYRELLTSRDAEFEKFRKEHALALKSLSTAIFDLQEQVQGGKESAHVVSPPPGQPGEGAAPAVQPVIAYEYVDKEGRFHLTDPNIWSEGDEVLLLKQLFRVQGTVLRQEDGSLMSERIQLQEVSKEAEGKYRELAVAQLVDANFTYANPPEDAPPPNQGISYMATLGTSFRSEGMLRFGASARVLRLGSAGLAGGLSSDFNSLEGSGGDAFLTYTPSLRGRELGLVLGGGVHLPLGGSTRVRPNLTLSFVIY
jgi:hypothetical protein